MAANVEVFFSYAHEDETWRIELEKHLSILQRKGLIAAWYDRKIAPGTEWANEIDTHLKSAQLILLLISSDFLASNYCWGVELQEAMRRHHAGEACVIPIILRPTDWDETPFAKLQALPTDGKPVSLWHSPDEAFVNVALGIRTAIDEWQAKSLPGQSLHATAPSPIRAIQEPIWTIPFRRNPFFTGREEVFLQLYAQLQNTQTAALSQPVAMSGLGGIGKTQTAIEYAYRHKDEYQVVCWIKSSTPEELVEDFASIAKLLHLPEQQIQEQAQIIAAVKLWFETHAGWLLIFDNADNLATIVDYLPQGHTGHVLITTRVHTMSGIAEKIEMRVMNQNEGARLLLKRAGMIDQTHPFEQLGKTDLQNTYSIIQELGGLPLALDQAGAYLEETGENLSSYLLLYKQQRAELLQRRGGIKSDHAPVATTWTLAFHNIEDSVPAAIELIKLFAFLAPDEIPEELLTGTAHLLNPSLQSLIANQTRFNEAIKELLTYSLIQRDRTSKTLSIHRLVQAVIKDEMSKTQQAQQAEYVVRMISHLLPFNEVAPWTRSQRYLSHALLAVEYIRQSTFTFNDARTLLNATGIYFQSRGQYGEAEPLLQKSRAITEKHLGPDHLETANCLINLANLYNKQGKYEQAEPLYQRAFTRLEKQLGSDHPTTAICLENLATLYFKQGKYEQAEALYQRALAIHEKKLGSDHPDTAFFLNNLAILYAEQGKYEQAEPLYQRAFAIREKKLGSDHPDTADSLNSLANLYTNQGKYEQVEPLSQRALAISEKRLGSDHPNTAFFLTSLANLYTRLGKYEQAEPLYLRALAIFEQRLGPDHLDTATCLDHFANFYQEQGKYEQAESLHQRALAIFEQRLGSDNPRTVKVRKHYSQLDPEI